MGVMDALSALLWLTLNIYHEARGEDQLGQIAVAHVTMNRAQREGTGIKEVVLAPYQFSWTHQIDNWLPDDTDAFMTCLHSALVAASGHDLTGGATYYHEQSIRPYWVDSVHFTAQYGNHKFYRGRGE